MGTDAPAIPQNVKILDLADHYCASISGRTYRKTLLPCAARCFPDRRQSRRLDAVRLFIKELGSYPPGTFVRLQNGEVGVVTGKGASAATPIVQALVGPRGAPLSFPIKRDSAKQLFAIHDALSEDEATLRFSLQQLWGDEASL